MKLKDIQELDNKYFMDTFGKRTEVCFDHGIGVYLYDIDGKEYMDLLGGIAVNALGHAHPKLVGAICEQASKVIHTSSLYYIEPQAKLAELLCSISCADKVFFANSGAEANEGAIKLARAYYKKVGKPEKYEIITFKNSFHGRTIATLSATGQEKYQKKFVPINIGFKYVDKNDINELESAINEKTCAIMTELVQGESGVNPIDPEILSKIKKLCDDNEILLIFDEIQTGIGRLGTMFGYQTYGIEPDIFTLAKALGGGVPIGALLAKGTVALTFEPGDHGSTFGGNPLATASALAVLETILSDGLLDNCSEVGQYAIDKLSSLSSKIKEIRGKGLMIGIELNTADAVLIKNKLFEKGFLVGSVGANILRILPPLIISKSQIDKFVEVLSEILGD